MPNCQENAKLPRKVEDCEWKISPLASVCEDYFNSDCREGAFSVISSLNFASKKFLKRGSIATIFDTSGVDKCTGFADRQKKKQQTTSVRQSRHDQVARSVLFLDVRWPRLMLSTNWSLSSPVFADCWCCLWWIIMDYVYPCTTSSSIKHSPSFLCDALLVQSTLMWLIEITDNYDTIITTVVSNNGCSVMHSCHPCLCLSCLHAVGLWTMHSLHRCCV